MNFLCVSPPPPPPGYVLELKPTWFYVSTMYWKVLHKAWIEVWGWLHWKNENSFIIIIIQAWEMISRPGQEKNLRFAFYLRCHVHLPFLCDCIISLYDRKGRGVTVRDGPWGWKRGLLVTKQCRKRGSVDRCVRYTSLWQCSPPLMCKSVCFDTEDYICH